MFLNSDGNLALELLRTWYTFTYARHHACRQYCMPCRVQTLGKGKPAPHYRRKSNSPAWSRILDGRLQLVHASFLLVLLRLGQMTNPCPLKLERHPMGAGRISSRQTSRSRGSCIYFVHATEEIGDPRPNWSVTSDH